VKVLFLTEFYPATLDADVRGGVELRTFHTSQGISNTHDVTVVAVPETRIPTDQRVGRVRVLRPGPVASFRQSGAFIARLRYIIACQRLVVQEHPDILIAENFLAYLVPLFLGRAWRQKTVLTYHDVLIGTWFKHFGPMMGLIGEVVERIVLRTKWRKIICNSLVTKKKVLQRYKHESDVTVVYSGVNIEHISTISPEQFQYPTIVAVARLVRYKRLDDLFRAVAKLRNQIHDLRLMVIGSGPERSRLEKLAESLGITSLLEWRGFVRRHEDVIAAIKGATIFSLPSAVEGFGLVTLEAMACGTPYVNSDIPPTNELSHGGQGGRLYPLGDWLSLSKNLFELFTDQDLRHQMSIDGQRVAREYSWQKTTQEFISSL